MSEKYYAHTMPYMKDDWIIDKEGYQEWHWVLSEKATNNDAIQGFAKTFVEYIDIYKNLEVEIDPERYEMIMRGYEDISKIPDGYFSFFGFPEKEVEDMCREQLQLTFNEKDIKELGEKNILLFKQSNVIAYFIAILFLKKNLTHFLVVVEKNNVIVIYLKYNGDYMDFKPSFTHIGCEPIGLFWKHQWTKESNPTTGGAKFKVE